MASLPGSSFIFLLLVACFAALSAGKKVGKYYLRGSLANNIQQAEQRILQVKPEDWIPCYLQIGGSCPPSQRPSAAPTNAPSSSYPTYNPTFVPTQAPTNMYQNTTDIHYALAGFCVIIFLISCCCSGSGNCCREERNDHQQHHGYGSIPLMERQDSVQIQQSQREQLAREELRKGKLKIERLATEQQLRTEQLESEQLAREKLRKRQLETERLAREQQIRIEQLKSEQRVREEHDLWARELQRKQLEKDQAQAQEDANRLQREQRFQLQTQHFSTLVAARIKEITLHTEITDYSSNNNADDSDDDDDHDDDDDTLDKSVLAEAIARRQRALEHFEKGKDLSIRSQQAWNDNERGLAKELSNQKNAEYILKDQFNKEAAELYFFYYNPFNGYNKDGDVDLHGLYKSEAELEVKECILEKIREGAQSVRFIVGMGNNSEGGIRILKPAVIGMVREHGFHFTDEEGAIMVHFR